jgi:type IV pilus assembly protein PilN
VGGAWFVLQNQNAGLEQQQAELDSRLGALNSQLAEVQTINTQITQINADTNALATVFNQIKPWSAMLQDVRERTPVGVQINIVKQIAPPPTPAAPAPAPAPAATPSPGATPAPTPAPAPPPTAGLELSGFGRSFPDVNDFVLALRESPFLKKADTKLIKAELVDNPASLDLSRTQLRTGAIVKLPKVVSYTIQTSLSDIAASELIAELNEKGAVGLVNRIETLRKKGVIQP